MRWAPVLILAYLAVGIQAGLSGEITIYGAGPNIGLLAAVFIAIYAPREPALLACVIIGGMQDLATQQAPGLFALSYGLVGWVVTAVQQVVYRDHPLTHLVLTFFAGVVTAIVVYTHGRIVPPRVSLMLLLTTAIYTAVL
ncbi:MAG: rod shape-determining protein MreD, partial [Phycisphaerae bacterium]|nr:rod shape-determining protein MreD [Phycisphaerae bacterium]